MRGLASMRGKRPRGIRHDKHVVALFDQRQGRERHADFCQDATGLVGYCIHRGRRGDGDLPDDNLFLAGLFYGIHKVLVVHGVDLSRSTDQWCVRKKVCNFLDDGAVGAGLKGCRQDRRRLEVLGHLRQAHHVRAEFMRVEVADELHKTGLVVDEQEHAVLCVESFVRGGHIELLVV